MKTLLIVAILACAATVQGGELERLIHPPKEVEKCVTKDEIESALVDALYYSRDTRLESVLAVYKSPSQSMREAADEMDKKDARLHSARQIQARLMHYGICEVGK